MIIDVVRLFCSGRPVYAGCRGRKRNPVQPVMCKAGAHYLKARPKKPKPTGPRSGGEAGPKRPPGRPRKTP